jgi:hypothetical protein
VVSQATACFKGYGSEIAGDLVSYGLPQELWLRDLGDLVSYGLPQELGSKILRDLFLSYGLDLPIQLRYNSAIQKEGNTRMAIWPSLPYKN